MFKIYDEEYLSKKIGVSRRDFHRKIKPLIIKDFAEKLGEANLKNPDIALDKNGRLYLVNPENHKDFVETQLNISTYTD